MKKIRFISIESLLEMKENAEKFFLVEVLSEKDFSGGHIPGALNLPLEKLEFLARNHLKKSDRIIVYCGSYHCGASTAAARLLAKLGYKNVLDFKAGKQGWVDAGLELEG